MSEEAKAAIRAGLEKARAAKLAATADSTPAQPTSTPATAKAAAGPIVTVKKDTVSDRGPVRAS
jgi:hypothetical protein